MDGTGTWPHNTDDPFQSLGRIDEWGGMAHTTVHYISEESAAMSSSHNDSPYEPNAYVGATSDLDTYIGRLPDADMDIDDLARLLQTDEDSMNGSALHSPTQLSPMYAPGRPSPPATSSAPHLTQLLSSPQPSITPRTIGVATQIRSDEQMHDDRRSQSYQSSPQEDDGVGDDIDDEESLLSPKSPASTRRYKPRRGERRTAHNLIEKKYRSSINDRIAELREMLSLEGGKMSKSATLRKAIETITDLRAQNEQLRQAYAAASAQLKALNAKVEAPEVPPMPQASTSQAAEPQRRAMRDRTRLTLFTAALVLLVVNPFIALLDESGEQQQLNIHRDYNRYSHGRQMLMYEEADDSWLPTSTWRSLLLWLINGALIFALLLRLLIYGEPVPDVTSLAWREYLRYKRSATQHIQEGAVDLALQSYCECLRWLGRMPMDNAFDHFAALVWQLFRHIVHRLVVWQKYGTSALSRARLSDSITNLTHRFTKGDKNQTMTAVKFAAESATLYHNMHKLQTLHNIRTGQQHSMSALTTALAAVNSTEAAGGTLLLPIKHCIEVYFYALLRVRIHQPPYRFLTLLWMPIRGALESHYHRSLETLLSKSTPAIRRQYAFLTHAHTRQLTLDMLHIGRVKELSGAGCPLLRRCWSSLQPGTVIETLTMRCRQHLLLEQMHALLAHAHSRESRKLAHERAAMLVDLTSDATGRVGDDNCRWWATLLQCALHWQHDERAAARLLYDSIRHAPTSLLQCPLALSAGHAFCARKLLFEDSKSEACAPQVAHHCAQAQTHLMQATAILGKVEGELSTAAELSRCIVLVVNRWLLSAYAGLFNMRASRGRAASRQLMHAYACAMRSIGSCSRMQLPTNVRNELQLTAKKN